MAQCFRALRLGCLWVGRFCSGERNGTCRIRFGRAHLCRQSLVNGKGLAASGSAALTSATRAGLTVSRSPLSLASRAARHRHAFATNPDGYIVRRQRPRTIKLVEAIEAYEDKRWPDGTPRRQGLGASAVPWTQ